MISITEGQLRFDFPDSWHASKFDEWSFYRNQFMKLAAAEFVCAKCTEHLCCAKCGEKRNAGTKGIDILAIRTDHCCWCIEIKDYRLTRVGDFRFLADAVALKSRDTLSALVVARMNANDQGERQAASQALACPQVRIVLHLEQPTPHSIQQSKATRRTHVIQRLKQLVNAIDPHPQVVDLENPGDVGWVVSQVGPPPA